jgi:hypothetical protein
LQSYSCNGFSFFREAFVGDGWRVSFLSAIKSGLGMRQRRWWGNLSAGDGMGLLFLVG